MGMNISFAFIDRTFLLRALYIDVRTHSKSDTYQYTVNQKMHSVFIASSHNTIVYTCYEHAVCNANTPMGSNIAILETSMVLK